MKLIKNIYAHCDVPCGIYETDTARHAADTVRRMCEKAEELHDNDPEHMNQFVRIVMVKEDHADRCKNQLQMLWSDYFKAEHLEQWPDLHDKFWQATKQCSRCKQSLDIKEADKLIAMVGEIAEIFAKTKK